MGMSNASKLLLLFGGGSTETDFFPTADRLLLWYAGNGATKPAEIDATGDGGAVTTWTDTQSAVAVTQATAGAKPTYRLTLADNSRGAVQFDGGDVLSAATASPLLATRSVFTVYIVFKTNSAAQCILFGEGSSASNTPFTALPYVNLTTAGRIIVRSRSDTAAINSADSEVSVGANNDSVHLLTIERRAEGAHVVFLDGLPVAVGGGKTNLTVNRIALGALMRAASVDNFTGYLQLVAAYSSNNRADAEADLMAHYVVTPQSDALYDGGMEGAWTWFNDPRAVHSDGKTFVGAVTSTGAFVVDTYDHTSSAWLGSFTLKADLQIDDHNNVALLRRASDGRLLAFYTGHNYPGYFLRISTNPDDASSWGAEANLQPAWTGTFSYANPIQLTGEANSPIYVFFRQGGQEYSKSVDGGVTWAAVESWLLNTGERPYLKLAQNGTDRIDFAFTDGHPAEVATNSIYHGYYQGGNLYQSDDTLIGAMDAGPYAPAAFTLVYSGATNRAWVHDIAIDGSGLPRITFAVFPTTTDHRYHYARWNGSAWVDAEICTAGTYLYSEEVYYSGGVVIDPAATNVVYASRQTGAERHQLWKFTTADEGANWDAGTQLTTGSLRSIRPFVVSGATDSKKLLYLTGVYTAYSSYAMHIVMREA